MYVCVRGLYKRSEGSNQISVKSFNIRGAVFTQRGNKMQLSHRPVQLFAVMVLVIFPTGHCQQNESRRAVTEHQLMHDRGRSIQSLKRLIWLSSAIEGLHTAQTRSAVAAFTPSKLLNSPLNPVLNPAKESPQPAPVQNMLRDFFYPHLNHLLDEEP
uniref:Parathyroid hormone-related protein n=1 Tax=Fundulus heteroclitus TaxID=8078 RepID=A0A146ZK40_FUNHE